MTKILIEQSPHGRVWFFPDSGKVAKYQAEMVVDAPHKPDSHGEILRDVFDHAVDAFCHIYLVEDRWELPHDALVGLVDHLQSRLRVGEN